MLFAARRSAHKAGQITSGSCMSRPRIRPGTCRCRRRRYEERGWEDERQQWCDARSASGFRHRRRLAGRRRGRRGGGGYGSDAWGCGPVPTWYRIALLGQCLFYTFFRDRACARFSLRREEKCYKRVGYRTTTDCRKTHKDDYTIPIERPGSLPNLQSTDSRHLNPA